MNNLRLPEQNQVFLAGRLTRDPDMFYTQQGTAKCSFSLAVNQNYKDKVSGEWKQQVSYIPVIVWRQAAERCKDRIRKGSPVMIEGRLRSREYEDKKTGGKRTVLEVEARRIQFLAASEGESAERSASEAASAGAEASESESADIEEVPF